MIRINQIYWFPLIFVMIMPSFSQVDDLVIFDGCDLNEYYSELIASNKLNDRDAMHNLLKNTQRKVLPYTSSNDSVDDVWSALIDLDGETIMDSTSSTSKRMVRLIYTNELVDALPHGTSTTWNREHIWPKSLGVCKKGADFSDVHHLRPSDADVNSSRGNKYFGACGLGFDSTGSCTSPAHREAAEDTEASKTTFLPPANRRGDVARALFFMAIRYDGEDDPDGVNLELSDCPDSISSLSNTRYMGYLSQLLEWHVSDPVDDEERTRNDRVCKRYQGNRNVFVDYPDLVPIYFGSPQNPEEIGINCPPRDEKITTCEIRKNRPSDVDVDVDVDVIDNDDGCKGLIPGDLFITAFNTDDPDEVTLVALEDLPAGAKIFVTDNGWTGTKFKTNEGTLSYTVPSDGITMGTLINYSAELVNSETWKQVQGDFSLSVKGDNINVYCFDIDSGAIVHLNAISNNGAFVPGPRDENDLNTRDSVLPNSLKKYGSVALSHKDNYVYSGTIEGDKSSLLYSLSKPSNWIGSNSESVEIEIDVDGFTITST